MSKDCPLIAIIDDEESVRRALSRLLRSAGMGVETFATGAEFLDSLGTRPPACVVLDLHMPQMNGFAVQKQLAALRGNVPVIIITGHDSPEAHDRAMAAGAAEYLRKPVSDVALIEAITRAVAGKAPG